MKILVLLDSFSKYLTCIRNFTLRNGKINDSISFTMGGRSNFDSTISSNIKIYSSRNYSPIPRWLRFDKEKLTPP